MIGCMMRRARWIYSALVCVMIALYRAIPDARVMIVAVVGLLSFAAICVGCIVQRPARRLAWLLIAGGMLVVVAGELSYNVMATGDTLHDFPSVPDVFYVCAYLPLSVGLLWLALPRAPQGDWSGRIETAALSLGGSLVAWVTLVRPTIESEAVSGLGEAILIAGWVGDVVVMVALLRLVIVWPRNAVSWLLAVGGVMLFLGDIRYGMDTLRGTWHAGGQVDASILAFVGLTGLAALMPSMATIGTYREFGQRPVFPGLAMLAVALMVAPTVLLMELAGGPIVAPIAVTGAVIGMLVIVRLYLAVTAHRRTIARDVVLQAATRNIGLAMSTSDVTASLSTALTAMAGDSVTSIRVTPAQAVTRVDVTTLRVPVPGLVDAAAEQDIVYTAPAATLSELEDELIGLGTQAGIALQRIELAEQVRRSEREQDALAYRASHDGLTGLANAELFRGELRNARHTVEPGRMTTVLFIDLDDFKNINDTLGHEAGDTVLVATARRIGKSLRAGDIGARLGGDEFAVLLRDIGDEAAAYVVARRLTEALAQPTMIGNIPVTCRASIGLATASEPGQYNALLRRADTALYAAKADGKGRWREYHPQMQSPLRRGTDLRIELERALRGASGAANGLSMHYQPIIELVSGAPAGLEALIRWEHPERGPINVPDLIALAEHTGLIVPLGEWVFAAAFRDGVALTANGCYVSVNVSVAQLRLPGFTGRVREQLRASPIDPERVVIEITESQLVSDNEQIWDDLADLRTLGVRVAIDDYGTGYASLSYLRQPVIDIVKLDRRFLDDIDGDRPQALLRAVLSLANELKLPLIAEGIEDDSTRESLLELGCEYGQGHLFAKAMPFGEAKAWLDAR
jgi:diguanylate cyclase (GGDEF)-like protein